MMAFSVLAAFALAAAAAPADVAKLEDARDRQDRAFLERAAREASAAAEKAANDAEAQYRAALAESYFSEVAFEQRDKKVAGEAAESGIRSAGKAIALRPNIAEYHRIMGTLCGQAVPTGVFLALKYGRCARSSIDKAIQLDPRSAKAYLSRGVGNFYLPKEFGGGVDLAIQDFEKAIQLDPKSADAHLWLGIALRKSQRSEEAYKEISKSLALNPNRIWARQQLEKTPRK